MVTRENKLIYIMRTATCHVYEISETMRLQSSGPNVEPTIALLKKAYWRWTDVPK